MFLFRGALPAALFSFSFDLLFFFLGKAAIWGGGVTLNWTAFCLNVFCSFQRQCKGADGGEGGENYSTLSLPSSPGPSFPHFLSFSPFFLPFFLFLLILFPHFSSLICPLVFSVATWPRALVEGRGLKELLNSVFLLPLAHPFLTFSPLFLFPHCQSWEIFPSFSIYN